MLPSVKKWTGVGEVALLQKETQEERKNKLEPSINDSIWEG